MPSLETGCLMPSEFYRDPGAQGFLDWLARWWHHENEKNERVIAHRASQRSFMDGHVIRKTGEVIPKESV